MNATIDTRRTNSNATANRLFDAATAELEAAAATMLKDANALMVEAAKIQRRKGAAA